MVNADLGRFDNGSRLTWINHSTSIINCSFKIHIQNRHLFKSFILIISWSCHISSRLNSFHPITCPTKMKAKSQGAGAGTLPARSNGPEDCGPGTYVSYWERGVILEDVYSSQTNEQRKIWNMLENTLQILTQYKLCFEPNCLFGIIWLWPWRTMCFYM